MNIPLFPVPLALPGDREWLGAQVLRPGGLCAVAPDDLPRLGRVIGAQSGVELIGLGAGLGDGDAVLLYHTWLGRQAQAPDAFAVWFNLGVALMRMGDRAQAIVAYGNALALKPELAEAAINLGLAYEGQGQPELAMATWRRALPSDEQRRVLHLHLGRMLEDQGRLAEACAELRATLLIEPDQPDVHQHWLHMRQRMAEWPVVQPLIPGLDVDTLARNCGPLAALALYDDPAMQRDIAAAWLARKQPDAPGRLAPASGYDHPRLRIGYLSTDFCRHAMSFLIAEVLERHDRNRFEVFGYCASPEDGSDIRARVIAAFDHHVPIGALGDEAAARRIRADEIDILIDLNGLTKGARLGVLRWKPAPVQATYLGYIGPVPLPELDWLICDDIAIPPALADQYLPRPLPLAGCYQANDSRPPELPAVSRAEEGLPEDRFVYCCFSHHYKITPALFDGWLSIMTAVPDAVFWLIEDGPASRHNLTARWVAHGLDPARLIFAPRVDPARYRARMALADLFLDTTPYNAGTIASDALRMGLPLLTLAGRAFAARMATSLLTTIGLTDCIATDMADYVARAVAFGQDPARHAALRRHLAGDAWTRTLGDSAAFTARLEAALTQIALRPGAAGAPS